MGLLLLVAISECLRTSRSAGPIPPVPQPSHTNLNVSENAHLWSCPWFGMLSLGGGGHTFLLVLDASPPALNPTLLQVVGPQDPSAPLSLPSLLWRGCQPPGSCGE